MIPAHFLGTFTTTGTAILGYVPQEGVGLAIRALSLTLRNDVKTTKDDYWTLQLGLWTPQQFQALAQVPLQNGVRASGLRFPIQGDPRVQRGATLALRASQHGAPPPLEGLSVLVEYGILGVR